jgi:hypothetical protein
MHTEKCCWWLWGCASARLAEIARAARNGCIAAQIWTLACIHGRCDAMRWAILAGAQSQQLVHLLLHQVVQCDQTAPTISTKETRDKLKAAWLLTLDIMDCSSKT